LKKDEISPKKPIKIRTQYCSLSPNPESLNVQKNLVAKDVTRSFD